MSVYLMPWANFRPKRPKSPWENVTLLMHHLSHSGPHSTNCHIRQASICRGRFLELVRLHMIWLGEVKVSANKSALPSNPTESCYSINIPSIRTIDSSALSAVSCWQAFGNSNQCIGWRLQQRTAGNPPWWNSQTSRDLPHISDLPDDTRHQQV